jgi:hypothetical protein
MKSLEGIFINLRRGEELPLRSPGIKP